MTERRNVIVLDTETDGLDTELNRAVEVGYLSWPDGDTGPRGLFIPPHTLDYATPEALRINGYHQRIAHRRRDYGYAQTRALHDALSGNTLAGANVAFDAAMLSHLFREANLRPYAPWHHRLLDIEAYAGGLLGFAPWDLPGLTRLCETVGVPPGDHGAWADAVAAWHVLSAVADHAEALVTA
ncbi:3'-5' exonuclease [Pseudonocardia sp. D17]|uniref:3'-5' exonuclease n=1 Tax=Pseudonocardia sp. D17 TaxID=882661 RepID=UPI002B3F4B96|nr:hypothetical protein PSD17_56700 [Pseudonocardia sp. D17]